MKARSSATVGEPAPAGSGYFILHKLVAAKKYYYAGSQRVAMRSNGTLYWLFGDHLGSTSVVAAADGTKVSETRYKAWGEVRFTSSAAPTKYGYTGQYSYVSDFRLMFYNARWYDPALGRFAQADTIVPGMWNPAAFDRYAYVYNRPVSYTDPSGHAGGIAPNGSIYYGTDIGYASIRVWNPKYTGGSMGDEVAPGTSQAQFAIHENSCGPTCIAAITGLSANSIWIIATQAIGDQYTAVNADGGEWIAYFIDPADNTDANELMYILEMLSWETQLYVFPNYTDDYYVAIQGVKEKIQS